MPAYLVTGAGDASYNGLYEYAGEIYGFAYYTYQPGNTSTLRRLQYYPVSTPPGDPQNFFWILNNGVEETPVYMSTENEELPGGIWTCVSGTAPAPTITEWIEIPTDYFIWGFSILTPADNATISGVVPVAVVWDLPLYFDADDDLRVVVEANGQVIHSEDFTGPTGALSVDLDTTRMSEGAGNVQATLYRKSGNNWLPTGTDLHEVTIDNATAKPSLVWSQPVNGQQVAGEIWLHGYAGLSELSETPYNGSVVVQIDGIALNNAAVSFPSADGQGYNAYNYQAPFSIRLDTRNLTDGLHEVSASFTFGALTATALLFINVLNGAVSYSDATPPVVVITAPADDINVTGAVVITAEITDADSGISHAILYVNGLKIERIDANGSGDWQWLWQSINNVNGTYTLTVTAWDRAGNSASDSIDLNVVNTLADSTKVLYTKLMTADDFDHWQDNDKLQSIEVVVVNPQDVPENATRQCNVNVYRGNGTADYTGMSLLTPGKSSNLPVPGEAVRWAMVAMPRQVWASWESSSTDLVKFSILDNGNLIVLATGPAQLLELRSTGLVQWASLSGLTPVDMVAMGGKVFVASGATVYIYDQDTGDRTFTLSLDTDVTSVDRLLQSGETLLVACATTLGTGRLYEFTYDRLIIGATYSAPLTCLLLDGTTLYVGDGAGKVLRRSGASFVLEYDTAQAGGVTTLGLVNNRLYVGTGNNGKMFAKVEGNWAEVADFTFSTINDFVTFDGWAYVLGPTADLWCEDAAGAWALQFTLTNATGVNDALVITADDTEQLYLATSRGAATAEILRLEIAPTGTLVCGPEPPDLQFKVLRSR